MNSLWWLQIVWQMELKFSIIQTELGLSELNQGLHGKKNFFFNVKQRLYWADHKLTTRLLQLQNVMYWTGLDYNYLKGNWY